MADTMPSWPRIQFSVALTHGPDGSVLSSSSVGWMDLGPRMRGPWSAPPSGRQYELDQVQSGTLTLALQNQDRLLDPTNSSSPVAPYMVPMRPCRMEAVWPPSQNRLTKALASGATTAFVATAGAFFLASGLVAAPSGHTTASSWAVPASTPAGAQAVPGTNGVTVIDSTAITVTPGERITLSAYLSRQAAGGDTTVQSQVSLAWFRYDETYLSTSGGAVATVPRQGSWVRAIAIATVPAGAAYCRPVWQMPNATVAANLLYATGWQWERATAATAWADPGTVYPLWTGAVERWPQTWDYQGTYGLLKITAIDAMAALATQNLEPSLPLQLKRFSPSRMFPLNEPEQSTQFYDATGKTRPAVIGISRGLGGGTLTSGQSVEGGGSYGNPGPVLRIDNPFPSLSIDSGCSFLVLDKPGPPTTGAWTRIVCFRTTQVPVVVMTLWCALGPGAFVGAGSQARAWMYLDPAGTLNVQIVNSAGLGGAFAVPIGGLCDGNWHLATMGLSASGLVMNASVDGQVYGITLAQNSHPTGIVADLLGSCATYPTGANLWNYDGDLAYATEVPSLVSDPDLNALGEGFADGWIGDPTWQRMGRILDLASYKGPWRHGAANSSMGGFPGGDTDVMSALQVLADTEAGAVFVPGSGALTVHGRAWRFWQTSPVATFGEDAAAGEIPYNGDFVIDHDPTRIYNTVTVTNTGAVGAAADTSTEVSATDYASQAQYLPRSMAHATNLADTGDAAARTAASPVCCTNTRPLTCGSARSTSTSARTRPCSLRC